MNRTPPSPKIWDLTERLIAIEAAGNHHTEANTSIVFRVTEKLRRPLGTLTGTAGFNALMGRALVLAKTHEPELNSVTVKANGSLEGLTEAGNDGTAKAEYMVVAQLIGLLFTFVGESITLRLLYDVWPDLPVSDTRAEGIESR